MRNKLTSFLILSFVVTCFSLRAQADQSANEDLLPNEVNKASNASFDKRLPPVLPGEVLNDGHSKSKVWSTSGSLPVGQVPQAPKNDYNYNSNVPISGVIVDQREDKENK